MVVFRQVWPYKIFLVLTKYVHVFCYESALMAQGFNFKVGV